MAQVKPWPRAVDLSPLLVQVARAIAHHPDSRANLRDGDHLAALIDLARITLLSVPARGVVVCDDLRNEIDQVADRHLNRRAAQKKFLAAIQRVQNRERRDAIDSAHIQIVELSELAHYYAGLAAGLTLADLGRK